ncbi:lipoyl(octanoyl) transferase LipB [Peptococcaceae bacterium 1198_IL3148]
MMKLQIAILGETDYQQALNMQMQLLALRQQGQVGDIMLLLQHPPTLTMGMRENRYNILVPEEQLKAQGASIYKINRGGDVTYHGPGQIVGYPILDLKNHGKSVKGYVNKLEEVFIQLLKDEYNLNAHREPAYRGVWINDEKITAIGCSVKRWVTMHGFAFNVNTNLQHFQWINPCGITDKGVTSLQKILGQSQDIDVLNQQVITYFCRMFNVQPQLIEQQQLNRMLGGGQHE